METETAALPVCLPFLSCSYSPYMNGDNGSSPLPCDVAAADTADNEAVSSVPTNGSSVDVGDVSVERCNGLSPVATSGEDSVPFKCHSNGTSSAFEGKVVANPDGVICCMQDGEDILDLWPWSPNSYQYSSESAASPSIPPTLYPFDFLLIVQRGTVSYFRCCFPNGHLPASTVLERYRRLPLPISTGESQLVFMCLLCDCQTLANHEAFVQHGEAQHDLSVDLEDCGGIIQKDAKGTIVVTKLLSLRAIDRLPEVTVKTEEVALKTNGFNDGDDSDHSTHSFPEDLTQPTDSDLNTAKSSSVECPKCDIVLGSSKSLGGHMTMVHSRNSSKKLKCPKCNWHYKYQETLEIHMKDKHPESEETCPYCLTNQPHPRLSRGEVYNCGYKPFRCETCNYSTTSKGNLTIHMQSDKHVTNVQERQKNGGENGGNAENNSNLNNIVPDEPPVIQRSASTSSAQREPFRCEVCGYETRVQRNLRIHLTSEKHQQNQALFFQSQMGNIHPNMAAGLLEGSPLMFMNMNPEMMGHHPLYMMGMPALMVDAGQSRPVDKIPENARTLQCLVCSVFMVDSYEELREHVTRDRTDSREQSDSLIINGQLSMCKYCPYKTPLKANFQLHCKTDKHIQKMQLVNHVREGGVDNEWRLQYLNTSNPVQVRCNACDYQTSSLHQLRSHLENNQQHEVNVAALVKLHDLQLDSGAASVNAAAARENLLNASSALIPSSSSASSTSTRKWKLFCSLCTFTAKYQSVFMQHVRSAGHWNQWKQHQLDAQQHSDLAYFITVKPAESDLANRKPAGNLHNGGSQPDYSEFEEESDEDNADDIERDNGHQYSPSELDDSLNPDSDRSSMLQTFTCPLCQEAYPERNRLETHLISKHNVHAEALERLMMLVETSGIWNNGNRRCARGSGSRDVSPSSSDTDTKMLSGGPSGDGGDVYRCQKCAMTFNDIEQLYQHQNTTGHLELTQTPRGPGYLCWKKGCNQYFKSATSLQIHFREIHARKTGGERMDVDDIGGVGDENSLGEEIEDEMNTQALAENGYRDQQRKYKCHRCKVAFTKQIYLSAHNKTPQHRKGEKCNTSMEKYQDPNRPHKCEVCKESFTQKNILLVHYNSVAHLHKMKKYRLGGDGKLENLGILELTPPPAHPVTSSSSLIPTAVSVRKNTFEDENKPYRCATCQVAYASKSNLDIHWRSVAHQSRLAKSQQSVVMDLSKPDDPAAPKAATSPERRPLPAVPVQKEEMVNPEQRKPRSLPAVDSPRASIRPAGRGRGSYGWASMLENIGVEMVQQFLENGQKPVKKARDTMLEPVEDENRRPPSTAENECSTCHKVFSSPWILKVHRESAHVDIVPIKILETVAAEYRKVFAEKAKPKPKEESSQPPVKCSPEAPLKKVSAQSNSPVPPANYSADLLAAQMQLLPLLYPGVGGIGMMGMQAMMNLQPPLISPNVNYPGLTGFEALNLSELSKSVGMQNSSSKLLDLQSGQKRNRTRITDEQLQILRANFDIRNPPSDELLQRLCEQTGLELKVVKHWYRNTLFKERQRNKDSPYNFSVPPNPVGLEMETDEKVEEKGHRVASPTESAPALPGVVVKEEKMDVDEPREKPVTINVVKREESVDSIDSRRSPADLRLQASLTPSPTPGSSMPSSLVPRDDRHAGKRANRTRFTDFQALQDYFDKNAYPKDDDLEDLSRALGLSPRVITVWFQNARQKARKTYENQTPPEEEVPIIRTPSLNYQCKRCLQVFQRYYELIKHTRSHCSGTSAGLGSGGSKDVDDTNSIASTSSAVSGKIGGQNKNETLTAQQQQKLWEASMGVSGVGQMLGVPPFIFPGAAGLYPPNSPFGILQMEAISSRGPQSGSTSPFAKKRSASSDEEEDESPNNKRVRTTIQPEQLDYLYQQYKLDSNPSRKQLEIIAAKTGLKKRVAQVWYQNTRARERKGQLHLQQLSISKRCPVCRRHFKVRSALESHISVKHADVYCKGDVNIDELPDTDSESNDDRSGTSSPVPPTSARRRNMEMAASLTGQSPSTSTAYLNNMNESMVKYYGETVKKYLQNKPELATMPSSLQSNGLQENVKPSSGFAGESPLDLSSAQPKAPSHYFHRESSGSGGAGERDYDSHASSPERSLSSSAHHQHGKPGKRFRTQMSNAQLKVMKRLFADYKTPTMGECDLVGREIGLQKRVVQVWFQNARAKEKKNKMPGTPDNTPVPDRCTLCNVVYTPKLTLQDHLFTKGHLEVLKTVEECTDGPAISTPMVSAPRDRGQLPSRKHVEVERKAAEFEGKKAGHGKGEASSTAGQGQVPVAGFGDLGALMMSDPSMAMYAAMYASAMNPYYNPAAGIPGMLPYGGFGAFYDPSIQGVPLGGLSLPSGVPELIFAKLNDRASSSGGNSVAFGQDGKRLSDLKECISAHDFTCATSKQSDIGTVCRKCQLVFPTEDNCTAHQAALCYPGTKTAKNVLKLMQIYFHCIACQKSFPTVAEFRNHCNSSTHHKNRQEKSGLPIKRPSLSASESADRLGHV
ncbi:zinc finger homeobox protein 4-like isoform X2 [Paramacrobiotus metropolitanus]|uniref:zinc finger homeobox protein 4-like isoform X2 n=1 Tax=Paramacrobiotus metropolitanus TaxID=2943436 RepID=UPI002445DFA0|nr:zinc finger homeobox protein 4-like isoform X2 [Paramacrobiotus metropolitanus]